MRKRTNMNLDMELVGKAREVLGTRNATDTVHAALDEAVKLHRRRRLAANDLPGLTPARLAEIEREERGLGNVDLSDADD